MESKPIVQSVTFPCTAQEAYDAWIDSHVHGEMLGTNAKIEPRVGGHFSIWDGTITGKTLELHPKEHRIVQAWRYAYDEWPKDQFSRITLLFSDESNGYCTLHFSQTGVPKQYTHEIAEGWKEYYWEPMKHYFTNHLQK